MKVKSKIMLEINEIKIRKTIEEKYKENKWKKKTFFSNDMVVYLENLWDYIFLKPLNEYMSLASFQYHTKLIVILYISNKWPK